MVAEGPGEVRHGISAYYAVVARLDRAIQYSPM